MRRVYVLATSEAVTAMRTCIPDEIIRFIIGKEFDLNENFEIETTWLGQPFFVSMPPGSVRLIDENL